MATVRKALKKSASGSKPHRLQPPGILENPASDVEPLSLPSAIPKQYPPLVLIHIILLVAALILLPTTPIQGLPLPQPARGLDKPQHPFLVPITARPVLTLAWACVGAVLLVPWWAGSLRRWAHDGTLGWRTVKMRLIVDPHKQRVRPAPPSAPLPDFISCIHAGHLERLHIHCVHGSGAARRNHLIRGSIYPVRPLYTLCSACHPHSLGCACFLRYVPHTALLALLLSLYTVFPPAYVLGPPSLGLPLLSTVATDAVKQNDLWVRIFVERGYVTLSWISRIPYHIANWSPCSVKKPFERALLYPTYGAFLGAWIGVIPIGLDWDRPWQVTTL
jgi:GPI ethanolamine phosphate transferase 2/3 subunit F